MKPFDFPERITRPRGASRSRRPSIATNSSTVAADSVLAAASGRSKVSHASPSPSRESVQLDRSTVVDACSMSIDPLDEHRPALPAADADRREAAPAAGSFEDVQHVQYDARAGRADRMADRDRATVDVQAIVGNLAER